MGKAGWEVHVIEKHETPGGRARQLKSSGFTFDMGPSWYWMPEVFEKYFASFGKKVTDYYQLKRLDPSYRIYWNDGFLDIPADISELKKLLNSIEVGAGEKLDVFLQEAEFKYKLGIGKLVYKPGLSFTEYLDWQILKGIFKLDVFTSMQSHIRKYFRHPRIRQIMEFPILFLGALAQNTPALYSLMNYADIVKGTWYPEGGMYSVVMGMYQLALELGVQFHFSESVHEILIDNKSAKKVFTDKNEYRADAVIGGADYQYIENNLLPVELRTYSNQYWDKKLMAPSCLLYYVGLNKKLTNIRHHSLFFDVPFDQHSKDIYVDKQWPRDPLFYVSTSSVTDPAAAPDGCENLVFLIPVAAGLKNDDAQLRGEYFDKIVRRLENHIGEEIRSHIVYKESFGLSDFISEYNSFKGNAYGLANTIFQTAVFRPSCRSKKVKNLFYAGQLTVPGPGVPPCIISGEVVAKQVVKYYGS